jgi:MerR family transcriptional regulator, light-induced transcriptional regulator
MNESIGVGLSIGTVERETGLSKDVLRVWERRYGFPNPLRDSNGDRLYPADQVERLRLVKRLLDEGMRPNRVMKLDVEALQKLLAERVPDPALERHGGLLKLLQDGQPQAIVNHLQHQLATHGLQHFVMDALVEANQAVGAAWAHGHITIFQEHLYTEQVQNVLRQAMHTLPQRQQRPRVVLTTLPGELHSLGLLMVQAVLVLHGAEVRSFGTQMPVTEIAGAVRRHRADVAALSFSAAFPAVQAGEALSALRDLLPPTVDLWAGGAGLRPLRHPLAGVQLIDPLEQLVATLEGWRAAHGGA